MLTAGMFIVYKTTGEQVDPVTVAAAEDLIRILWYIVLVLPLVPFMVESDPTGIFKRGDNMVGGGYARRHSSQPEWTISYGR